MLVSFDQSDNTGAIDVKMDGSRSMKFLSPEISINLPYGHAWNTVVMSGLVLLVATWNCQTSYKNEYEGLLVLYLLLLVILWLFVVTWPA